MSGKIILDLCGGTGAWSQPYREAGYDVRLVTLPEHDVRTYQPPANVHGILAAPPCTHFTLCRQNAKTPRDLAGAMEVVRACLEIIWKCRLDNSLRWWAMENPRGYLNQFIGKPCYDFQPYEFGQLYTKHTFLWGWFTPPRKQKVGPNMIFRLAAKVRPYDYAFQSKNRPENRAKTPDGFARAFFEANQ